jgi:hypothetical protein
MDNEKNENFNVLYDLHFKFIYNPKKITTMIV